MLVRMTWKGVPKFIRSIGVTRIAESEDGTRVDYDGGEFDFVDGTPDEVFKALFNPPETLLKEDVGRVLDDIDAYVSEVRRDPMQTPHLVHCIAVARRGLGLPPREQ